MKVSYLSLDEINNLEKVFGDYENLFAPQFENEEKLTDEEIDFLEKSEEEYRSGWL